jgi:hypothetical protein
MSDTEAILAAELEASRRRAEELTTLLDQERKVCTSFLARARELFSHHRHCRYNQRALEAEQRLREREKLLAEKDRPKVS